MPPCLVSTLYIYAPSLCQSPFVGGISSNCVGPSFSMPSGNAMPFSSPRLLRDANPRDQPVTSFCVPWFDSRDVSEEDILMPYSRNDHLPDDIPLFAMECEVVLSHMCAVYAELEVPVHGNLSARERFVRACDFTWATLVGRTSLPATAGLNLPFASSDDKYTFCRWLALPLVDSSPQFSGGFICHCHGICNVSQLIIDEVYV